MKTGIFGILPRLNYNNIAYRFTLFLSEQTNRLIDKVFAPTASRQYWSRMLVVLLN